MLSNREKRLTTQIAHALELPLHHAARKVIGAKRKYRQNADRLKITWEESAPATVLYSIMLWDAIVAGNSPKRSQECADVLDASYTTALRRLEKVVS